MMTQAGHEGHLHGLVSDVLFAARYARMALRRRLRGPGPAPEVPRGTPPPPGSIVNLDGINVRIDPVMSDFNVRKLAAGRHTVHERRLLKRILRDDDVVLELGGGIGTVAIACAQRLGPGKVTTYEANPELEPLIRENYALNGVAPELHMAMVGPESGSRDFHLSDRFSRSSLYDDGTARRTVQVPVHPFNEVMADLRPSVLVVDIQGGEQELLRYADFTGVRAILIELHPFIIGLSAMLRIRRKMRAIGFVTRDQDGQSFLYERA